MMVGPAIGSFLYELFGFQIVFLIVTAFNFTVTLIIIFLVPKEVVDINDQTLELENEENSVANAYNQTKILITQENGFSDDLNIMTTSKFNNSKENDFISVSYIRLFFNPIIFLTSIPKFTF